MNLHQMMIKCIQKINKIIDICNKPVEDWGVIPMIMIFSSIFWGFILFIVAIFLMFGTDVLTVFTTIMMIPLFVVLVKLY